MLYNVQNKNLMRSQLTDFTKEYCILKLHQGAVSLNPKSLPINSSCA